MLFCIDLGLAFGEFVTAFADLILCSFIGLDRQRVVLGFSGIDLGLQVFAVLLAVAGFATQLGAEGATQCAQVGTGVSWQGEQAEQKSGSTSPWRRNNNSSNENSLAVRSMR